MSRVPYMPLFTDAFIGDTQGLTLEERGAYMHILMVTWNNGGQALPDDAKRMSIILGVSPSKWEKLRAAIIHKFDTADGFLHQKRLEKQWIFSQKKLDQKSNAGRASALKKQESTSTDVATNEPTAGSTERQQSKTKTNMRPESHRSEKNPATLPVDNFANGHGTNGHAKPNRGLSTPKITARILGIAQRKDTPENRHWAGMLAISLPSDLAAELTRYETPAARVADLIDEAEEIMNSGLSKN